MTPQQHYKESYNLSELQTYVVNQLEGVINKIHNFRSANPLEWISMGYVEGINRALYYRIEKQDAMINFSIINQPFFILDVEFIVNKNWRAEYLIEKNTGLLKPRSNIEYSIDTNYRIASFSFKQAIQDLIKMDILNGHYRFISPQ